jgi:acyl-CoA thioesterase FadM
VITRSDDTLVSGSTEHALVDDAGRVRRIPAADRTALAALVAPR